MKTTKADPWIIRVDVEVEIASFFRIALSPWQLDSRAS
jgi:hypothetical protein